MPLHTHHQILHKGEHGGSSKGHGPWKIQMLKAVAVVKGGQTQKCVFGFQMLFQSIQRGLEDQVVSAHRQVTAMLLCGTDGQHIGQPAAVKGVHLEPGHLIDRL